MTIELELKRIADRLEMIHNHLTTKEVNPKLDQTLERIEEDEEVLEEQEYKVRSKVKDRIKKPIAKAKPKHTEEDVRKAAQEMITAAKKEHGDEEGKEKGKAEVKRVLKEFGAKLIEELEEGQYEDAIRAFARVAGTFVADAEESDELDVD